MSLLRLISTNLRRHLVRTAIGAAGIVFGVATMLCVITLLQGAVNMFEQILSNDSEIIVFEKNVSDLFFSNVPMIAVSELAGLSLVSRAEPALFGIVSSPDQPVVTCFGIRTDAARLNTCEWLSGSPENFTADDNAVVLGARASEFLGAKAGEEVKIGKRTFPVAGVIQTENGFEDGGVFMPLALCQNYFHKEDNVSVITIKLNASEQTASFKQHVSEHYPDLVAMENEQFSRSYSQFKILRTTGWVVGSCAFLLGGLSIANTMVMSVYGRIREIAVLRVCGFSRRQVAGLVFGESVMVTIIGVVIGALLSKVALMLLKSLPLLQGYVDTQIRIEVLLAVAVLAILTGMAGALYPACYAMKIKAAEALRFE